MRFTQEIRQQQLLGPISGHLGIGDCQTVCLVFVFDRTAVGQSKYDDDDDGHFGSGFCGPTNQINLICLHGGSAIGNGKLSGQNSCLT